MGWGEGAGEGVSGLVLSIFPGIDLLGRAFEEVGFTVVRGPDVLWGGDIHTFHPPPGRFDGIIGGPPCQRFSSLANLVRHVYGEDKLAPDLIPEFERCIAEAQPAWFLMENVPKAPAPKVAGYVVRERMVLDVSVGGETTRLRRFSFGTPGGLRLAIDLAALPMWGGRPRPDPLPAVLASGGRWVLVARGGSGKVKDSKRRRTKVRRADGRTKDAYIYGFKTNEYFRQAVTAQGLPDDFDLPGMTVAGKIKAVGNGVPLAMGRAVANAVLRVTRG